MRQRNPIESRRVWLATSGGLLAILLWSLTVALARVLSEELGATTSAAAVYTVSGVLALAKLAWRREERMRVWKLPRRYFFGCGLLFVCYMLQLFLAIGISASRQQAIEVGFLNYLWPTFTLVLGLVLLGGKARLTLLPGTALALIGMFLVLTQGQHLSWHGFLSNLASNPPAYLLGITAALSWALYSTLTRKWVRGSQTGGVMVFMPATAVVLLVCCLFADDPRAWSAGSITGVVVLGVATFVAYELWDNAMRSGNVVAVVSSSYLTPLFSAVVSCVLLSVSPAPQLWVGCGVLIVGSLLSWRSVTVL